MESFKRFGSCIGLAGLSEVFLIKPTRVLERQDKVALRATKEGMKK